MPRGARPHVYLLVSRSCERATVDRQDRRQDCDETDGEADNPRRDRLSIGASRTKPMLAHRRTARELHERPIRRSEGCLRHCNFAASSRS